MTLKLNFNTPCPKKDRCKLIKSFKDLGFSYNRVFQNGTYSLHRFYGRLPTLSGSSDVDLLSISASEDFYKSFSDVDYVEIYILIER